MQMQAGGPDVSIRVYALGELKTYSAHTLELYLQDMYDSEKNGENTAFAIHSTTAEFYATKALMKLNDI